MPAAITHYIFAKEAIEDLKTPLVFLKNEEYKKVAYVGAQGPDPLFFAGMNPFVKRKNSKHINQIGSYLHDHKMATKFIDMIEFANRFDGNQKDVLYSYIFGAMLHYCLDRVAHPFIFYRSGFSLNGDKSRNYEADHALYESYVDTMLQKNKGTNYKAKDVIKANKQLISLVSTMYAHNEKLESDDFYNAWRDMKSCEVLLQDSCGFKRWLFRKLKMENTLQYGMIHPKENDLKLDFLNLNREMYKNPQSLEKSQHSFFELYNIALQDVKNIVKLVKKAYNKEDVEEDMISYCGDINYEGTLENSNMREFDSILVK